MNGEILRLARQLDFDTSPGYAEPLIDFYRAAFNAGIEAAAKVADEKEEQANEYYYSDAIRALEMK